MVSAASAIAYVYLARAALQPKDYERVVTFVENTLNTTRRTETSIAREHLKALRRSLPPNRATDSKTRRIRDQLATHD